MPSSLGGLDGTPFRVRGTSTASNQCLGNTLKTAAAPLAGFSCWFVRVRQSHVVHRAMPARPPHREEASWEMNRPVSFRSFPFVAAQRCYLYPGHDLTWYHERDWRRAAQRKWPCARSLLILMNDRRRPWSGALLALAFSAVLARKWSP